MAKITIFMKRKQSKNEQPELGLSGTMADVDYMIGVPNPFTGQRDCILESRHLEALKFFMSYADRLDDRCLVSEQLFWQMTVGEDEVLELLVPLLLSWVRTCRSDESPVVTQFADIAVLNDVPERHFDIRFCDGMIPVLLAIDAARKQQGARAMKDQPSLTQNQKAYAKKVQEN